MVVSKCDQCEKLFNDKFALRRHQNVHTGEKPLKCKLCAKSFSQKEIMKTHITSHKRENPKTFKPNCDQCGKLFNDKFALIRHQNVHIIQEKNRSNVNYAQSLSLKQAI